MAKARGWRDLLAATIAGWAGMFALAYQPIGSQIGISPVVYAAIPVIVIAAAWTRRHERWPGFALIAAAAGLCGITFCAGEPPAWTPLASFVGVAAFVAAFPRPAYAPWQAGYALLAVEAVLQLDASQWIWWPALVASVPLALVYWWLMNESPGTHYAVAAAIVAIAVTMMLNDVLYRSQAAPTLLAMLAGVAMLAAVAWRLRPTVAAATA